MAYRELELTLLSAQELKNVNLITRMDVYAVVSISGDPLTRQSTEPDTYGGRNPCWNETFRFAVPPTAAAAAGASLQVLLRAERFLGDRDVGEVVVPLSDILASATGAGPQPPQVASYQVRKLHRWEPRGVLNVSYRLGAVVAPVVEPAPNSNAYYSTAGVPRQPSHPHPSAVAYEPAPPAPPAPGRPAARVAEHDEAAQNKSHVTGYPVGVPQQASHPPAKPDHKFLQNVTLDYRPPTPPRPAAVHAARHEAAARAPAPAPAPPTPAPPPTNARNNAGPTHVYMGPHSQIIFNGSPTTAGPPTRTAASPARSIISPAGNKDDGNWALLHESMSMSVISPRSRKEDGWRPSVFSQSQSQSQSQHDTQQQQQAASSPVAAPSHSNSHRLAAASPAFSRTSLASSPLSPYSSAHPSPCSSAHSSTRSPYSSSAHPSTTASPHPPLRPPSAGDAAEVTHSFRSTSSRGAAVSSPLPSSPLMLPSHSRGAAISSPLPSSSPLVPKHSSVVPSL